MIDLSKEELDLIVALTHQKEIDEDFIYVYYGIDIKLFREKLKKEIKKYHSH